MTVDITVPELGESISEVEIGEWLVEQGSWVKTDEELVELESDKATVELPSPGEGRLVEIIKKQGETAAVGEVIARLDPAAEGEEPAADPGPREESAEEEPEQAEEPAAAGAQETEAAAAGEQEEGAEEDDKIMPAAARLMARHRLEPREVTPTGPGGRILKEDVQRAVEERQAGERTAAPAVEKPAAPAAGKGDEAEERRERMTPIRRTIAARLLEATRNMALLTTFNEVDMSAVKQARAEFGESFAARHGVRLGFMSFFVRAAVAALQDFPKVNARIDGRDIVYRNSCDIGVAIGGGKGLVVPVLRRAETMSFAAIEKKIGEYAEKAKENSLSLEELEGGTFTISNGGVYGSMLSTPIVNPPQSAILGLHAINDRPVAIAGEVQIRPVMYLALSYDHRIIDGREAVTFLKSIKERIERPQRLLLEI